ncbi:DinI family protein [Proteus sp. GOKU]|jgi:DNA-damage-inducible protein I|uniref:DNA-damage-inducible protein n=5 Tax=Proteus TaxID=583 RepID=A0A094U7Q5_PROVU|nr:DinI family protein [Proteus vulgaris]PNL49996.1 DinI family protein [Proteus mirabilis]QPB80318.1 DinI family protein [Proteus sp. GOKU]AYY81564.1 DinI family protein [Proteus vulgaris]KGA58440.1 dinI-like family protein [Proteus vulgaris]
MVKPMRVEILFNKQSKITDSLFPLLEHELRKKIIPEYPDMQFRIAFSSMNSIQVTGIKDETKHEHIMELIQSVWEDDGWLQTDDE